ncbi:MAG: O-antigen ligase family protein, partial [Ardenticatenaceae bacterium]
LVIPLGYGIVAVGFSRITYHMSRITHHASRVLSNSGIVVLAAGCTTSMLLALFLTLSRGAWIGAGVAAVAVGMLLSRRAALLSLLAGAALVFGLALGGIERLPPALANRVTDFVPYLNVFDVEVRGVGITDQNFAVIERLAHWQAAYEMWADEPWLGQGVGNYAAVYPAYYIPPWEEPLGHAHNLFLNTLAEAGLIGLVAYLIFWTGALALSFRAVRSSAGIWRGVAVGILGAMVHLHVHNFFDNLYVHGMYLHLALLLAIAARLVQGETQLEESE